jgi:hypothetical protein
MRYLPVVAAVLLAVVMCASAPAVKAPVKDPMVPPMMSADGLEGLREAFLDVMLSSDADWAKATKYDGKQLRAEVEAKLREIPKLRITTKRSAEAPRLLVYVNGHTVPGYSTDDPPAFTHVSVALIQPVFLTRRGPAGQAMITNGICDERTGATSSRGSLMRERVRGKVASWVGGFVSDYRKANP